jgi:hypothetical protein
MGIFGRSYGIRISSWSNEDAIRAVSNMPLQQTKPRWAEVDV